MKGLFYKDVNLMMGNAKTIFPALGIGVIYIFFTNVKIGFAMSYMAMLFGMLALSTLAYDEENGGMAYLMTLPVSCFQYVLSKYLFLLFFMAVGVVGSLGVLFVSALFKGIAERTGSLEALQNVGFMQKEEWTVCLFVIVAVFLLNMILLPLRYKFGVAMQQVMIFAVVACVVFLSMMLGNLLEKNGINLNEWVATAMPGTAVLVMGGIGLCVVSFLVSLKIFHH